MQKREFKAIGSEMLNQMIGTEPSCCSTRERLRRQWRRLKKATEAAEALKALTRECHDQRAEIDVEISRLKAQAESELVQR